MKDPESMNPTEKFFATRDMLRLALAHLDYLANSIQDRQSCTEKEQADFVAECCLEEDFRLLHGARKFLKESH